MDGVRAKRRRAGDVGGADPRVRRAIAINARERSSYPYKTHGRAFYKRGSDVSRELFGKSFKEADAAQRSHRKALGYVGQGGYWTQKLFGVKPGSIVDRIGDAVADVASYIPGVGQYVKPALEGSANIHRSLTASGAGEYTTNSIVDGGAAAAAEVPRFARSGDGSVSITHREYIADVLAPGLVGGVPVTFDVEAYQINPGLEKSFPWLSQIAANYEEYTLHQCMFTFRSTVADFAAASGQVGQVIMATQYNAASQPFGDKRTMMEYEAAMSCKTSVSMIHGVECDPAKLSGPKGRFVRVGPPGDNQDLNQYDHAQLNVAVSDTPATYAGQSMGELWVSYTIELRKPRFWVAKGNSISRDVFISKANQNQAQPFGLDGAAPVYGAGQQNSIGCTLQLPTSTGSSQELTVPGVTYRKVNYTGSGSIGTVMASSGIVQAFKVQFPDWYQGPLRLSLSQALTGTNAIASYDMFASGRVRALKDWLTTTDAVNESNGFSCGAAVPAGSTTNGLFYMTYDLFVEAASGGVRNEIIFVLVTALGNITGNTQLEINELNYLLSQKQDGSNDQMLIVTPLGSYI